MSVQYIYLDLLWVDNLIMNFILLWITSKIAKPFKLLWRIWAGAILGAFYAVMLFLPGYEFLGSLPLKLALSLVMLFISFHFNSVRDFLKVLAIFYFITFTFGGAAFGMYYLGCQAVTVEKGIFYIKSYPVKILAVSCIVVVALIRFLWLFFRSRMIEDNLLYRIEVEFDGSSIMMEALLDTGNALFDPISHSPVIIVEYEKLKKLLPEEIQAIFSQCKENDLEIVTQVMAHSNWIGRFRMIPYTALGRPHGMLIGFKPDNVRVWIDKACREIKEIIVGVYNNKLSKESQYQALIHPEIIN